MAKTSTAKGKKSSAPASKKSAKSAAKPKSAADDCSKISDAKLAREVQKAIAKIPRFKNMDIHITAKAGAISLAGTASPEFKDAAKKKAQSVKCVKRVTNRITAPKSLGCDPTTEQECFCNGNVTCIPIGQDCPACIPPGGGRRIPGRAR